MLQRAASSVRLLPSSSQGPIVKPLVRFASLSRTTSTRSFTSRLVSSSLPESNPARSSNILLERPVALGKPKMTSAATFLDTLIRDLEDQLALAPGEPIPGDNPQSAKPQKLVEKTSEKKAKKSGESGSSGAKDKGATEQPEITKLDIRVGQIVKVWRHESAEKLYCEEIDVGEEAPRQIASGLVPHYTLEEMQNRRILVLCNLKPRNLVGFKSNGMVMCASKLKDDDSEQVEFVEPPADAKIGERISFGTLTGEPVSAAQVEKKKVLQNVFPDLITDGEGVAKWKDHVFTTTAGPCIAPSIFDGTIR